MMISFSLFSAQQDLKDGKEVRGDLRNFETDGSVKYGDFVFS
jgi:hypothetical protein